VSLPALLKVNNMKKTLLLTLIVLFTHLWCSAQSKIFKEVSEEISSQVTTIRQDNELVGYLVFTQLEKVSEDSFNYKVTIIDENLNEMSAVNFREQNLYLQNVAFEQDVLCVAYFKTNIVGKTFKNTTEYHQYVKAHAINNDVLLQFLDLNGHLLKRISVPLEMNFGDMDPIQKKETEIAGSMKHGIQLRNVPGQGFALFYGDDDKNILSVYKPDGTKGWQKAVEGRAFDFVILPSKQDVYVLMTKSGSMIQGDYDLACYGFKDGTEYNKHKLKAGSGNSLRAIAFNNDLVTGLPYLSGYLININSNQGIFSYTGMFTINFSEHNNSDPLPVYSYWANDSRSLSSEGYDKAHSPATYSFKDYAGNTYFAGIAFTDGVRKAKGQNSVLVKQETNGALSVGASVPNSDRITELEPYQRSYSAVFNDQAKNCYFIVADEKNTNIYDVNNKKIARTIPKKDGDSRIRVYPAKAGYIMVSAYSKKEKKTTVSIEAL
jgi:hypothetical protein